MIKQEPQRALANAEKIGFNTKMYTIHPYIKNKKLPIYFANFVLMDYGISGFGCQPHDQEFDFAKKYNLDILKVVSMAKTIMNLRKLTLVMGI